ncbi:MAG: GNAT family N-acetyltransferase [bacterium]
MEIKITAIEKADIQKTREFCQEIFKEMEWGSTFAYGLDDLKQTFSGQGEVFLVAKKGDEIIGCVGLKRLSEKIGLMKRFYIAQEFRGKGLAKLMFDEIERFAQVHGYESIVLDTYKDNERAKRFYEKQGFQSFTPSVYPAWPESGHPEIFEFKKIDLK